MSRATWIAGSSVVAAIIGTAAQAATMAFFTTIAATVTTCSGTTGIAAECVNHPVGSSVTVAVSGTFNVNDPTQPAGILSGPQTLSVSTSMPTAPGMFLQGGTYFNGIYFPPTGPGGLASFSMFNIGVDNFVGIIPYTRIRIFDGFYDANVSTGPGDTSSLVFTFDVPISPSTPRVAAVSIVGPPETTTAPIPLPAGLLFGLTSLIALRLLRRTRSA